MDLSLEEVLSFVETRIPHCRPFEGHVAAQTVTQGGILTGAVVWYNYDSHTRNIEVAIAADSPRWLSRGTLERFFTFPFLMLGCRRVTARIDVTNRRSRKLCEGLGFQLEGLLREASLDGGDQLIYGLLRRECRFLKETDA